MRDGVKHTRVTGVLFWNFHARLLNTGRLLAPNIWGAIFGKKIAGFKTALSQMFGFLYFWDIWVLTDPTFPAKKKIGCVSFELVLH